MPCPADTAVEPTEPEQGPLDFPPDVHLLTHNAYMNAKMNPLNGDQNLILSTTPPHHTT